MVKENYSRTRGTRNSFFIPKLEAVTAELLEMD
jgi:hypothetical protein